MGRPPPHPAPSPPPRKQKTERGIIKNRCWFFGASDCLLQWSSSSATPSHCDPPFPCCPPLGIPAGHETATVESRAFSEPHVSGTGSPCSINIFWNFFSFRFFFLNVDHFKVFIGYFYVLVFWLQGMWELSSLIRD